MTRIILALVLAFMAFPSLAQMTNIQRAELNGNNILGPYNPGFENGTQAWTNTGGSFLTVVTSANVGATKSAGSWSGSSGNILASTSVTLPAGMVSNTCQASILHKGGDANAVLEARDTTASSTLGSVTFATDSTYKVYEFSFACPSAQNVIQLRVRATGTAALMYLDSAFLGMAGPIDASAVASGSLVTGKVNFADTSDSTKKLAINLSGNTTGKTVTFVFAATGNESITFPDASDTLVNLNSIQQLENKALLADGSQLSYFFSGTGTGRTIQFDPSGGSDNFSLTLKSSQTNNHILTLPNATDTLVGKATTDTLTNKTLTTPIISSISNTGTLTLPTSTDTLVGKATTDALTNKDYQGATASNTSRFTTPSASQSTLTGLTRKQATLVYNTDTDQLASDDGTSLNPVFVPAVKNYFRAGSSTSAGWTASGAGITVADDVTAADLPRSITTKTGIKFTGASGSTAFGYYDFTLDVNDYNTKLGLQFAQSCGLAGGASSTCVASDFKVDVYSCTIAWSSGTCGGTSTRLALSTDSSAVSVLPALTGTYRTSFDAPGSTAKFIQIQMGMNATQTHVLVASDFVVGPGVVTQGAAISGWTSYTPTTAGMGTVTVNFAEYRRVGDAVEIHGSITSGTVTASALKVGLPTVVTANSHATNYVTGGAAGTDYAGADLGGLEPLVIDADKTAIQFAHNNTHSVVSPVGGSTVLNNGSTLYFHAIVPTNEWVGAGTVNVVQNDCEYLSNSSSTDAADTTSFVYGPAGSKGIIGTTNITAGRAKRVRSITPGSQTDQYRFEIYDSSTGYWTDAKETRIGSLGYVLENATSYGVNLQPLNATDIDVVFNQYSRPTGATFGVAGETWNSVNANLTAWRVKKCAGGQAIGFGQVTQSGAGLVTSAGQLLGTNTNDNAVAGNVGEVVTGTYSGSNVSGSTTLGTTTQVTSSNMALTPGDWDIYAEMAIRMTGCTGGTVNNGTLGTLQIYDSTNSAVKTEAIGPFCNTAVATSWGNASTKYRTTITANTTYQLKFYCQTAAAGSPAVTGCDAMCASPAPCVFIARRVR